MLVNVQAGTSTTSAGVVGSGGAGGLQNLIRAYQAGHSWLVGLGPPSQGKNRAVLPKMECIVRCRTNPTAHVTYVVVPAERQYYLHALFIDIVLL